jgi:hypothetical protein
VRTLQDTYNAVGVIALVCGTTWKYVNWNSRFRAIQ